MIKANELRLGNLVYRQYWNPNPGKENWAYDACRIEIIKRDSVNLLLSDGSILAKYPTEMLFPVLPTPERLERCGFKKMLLGDELCYELPFIRKYYDKADHSLMLINFGSFEDKSDGKYATAIRELDRDLQFGVTVLESLHQIQNFYFDLTGKELQINLKAISA